MPFGKFALNILWNNISHYVLRAKYTFSEISVHYLSDKSLSASYVIFMWRGKQTLFVSILPVVLGYLLNLPISNCGKISW